MQAVEVDAQKYQHAQAYLDGLRWFEAYCQLPFCDIEKEAQCDNIADQRQPWMLCGLQAAWNQAHGTMKLADNEICVAGSSAH